MDQINAIIAKCKSDIKNINNYQEFIVKDLSDIIYNKSDDTYIIKTNKIPLLYFFDKYLNQKINIKVIDRNNFFSSINEIYTISHLKKIYMIDIIIDFHSIILYPFEHNGRYYLYLSNSGLGISNQNTNINKTACKLFHITQLHDINKIYNMFLLITEIIQLIHNISLEDYLSNTSSTFLEKKKEFHDRIDNIWEKIRTDFFHEIKEIPISRDFLLNNLFKKIHENIKDNNYDIGYIHLIYVLLNYLAQLNFMNECTFNYILNNNDHPKYRSIINRLIYYDTGAKINFSDLYINCTNGYNDNVYKSLRENIDSVSINNNFINDIHLKLDLYASIKKTIQFKRDDFILELKNSGLFNYVQVGGSCIFYSFYNLFMNILFLTNCNLYQSNPTEAVQNFINPLLTIHYTLLEYLCMCNDTEYLIKTNNFYPNQIFHMNYIYNIMIKNNLMDEISDFYPSSSLMIFSKNPLIDRLLDFPISNDKLYSNKLVVLFDNLIVKQLKLDLNQIDSLFSNYINNIRNLSDLSIKSLITFRNKLYILYNKINLYIFFKDVLPYCFKYINISRDIIIIYCYYLLNLYKNNDKHPKKYLIKENKLKLLTPIFSIPDNINKDNCGALIDCKKKKCEIDNYECYYEYNIDYTLNKFSSYEIKSISYLLTNFNSDIIHINSLFILEECNNINISEINITKLNLYTNNFNYENVPTSTELIRKYFRNKYLSVNKLINKEQKVEHINNCKSTIESIISYINTNIIFFSLFTFKANIDKLLWLFDYDTHIRINELLNLLLFILTDGKYICLSNELCTDITFFSLLTLITDNTKVILSTNDFMIEQIYNLLTGNIHFFYINKLDNGLISFVNNSIKKEIDWIGTYNIIYKEPHFIYLSQNYIYNLQVNYYNRLSIILARFGLHQQNRDEYILLFPESNITDNNLNVTLNFNFFICIKKNKTIIELNIVDHKVDINNCYLFKNQKKHKLVFNINAPFLCNFTEITPYLCYKENNKIYIDTIVSNAFWSLSLTKIYKYLFYLENINKNEYKTIFDIYQFEIASSTTFPTIKTNNIEYIKNIHKLYPSDRKLEFSKKQLLKRDLMIEYTNINQLSTIIKKIAKILCKNINCDQKTNETFKNIFIEELKDSPAKNDVLESFLKDNRLCVQFDFNHEIILERNVIQLELEEILKLLLIQHSFDKCQFIIDNLTNIIILMEINIVINELFQINRGTSCWDIQLLLTKLDNILLFNKDIQTNSYYLFELLFLFQNNYFFKENQLTKYKQIVDDIIKNNGSLTIHQFMMGKGKTSFLTPLLSMTIHLMTGKKAIVITTDHLIPQTKKIMEYIHLLGDIPFEVATDYEYKHFWLEKTDTTLKKNFNVDNHQLHIENILDTSLIIDEFNNHYDYTQSMFNLVKKQEYISQEMFYYIFDYIHSKILKKPILIKIAEIANYEIINSILDNEYNIAINLKYNEKYGFSNISGDLRLCIPYARKDSPLLGSRFSSIILTIILTINYYIKVENYKLDPKYDYPLIIDNDSEILKYAPIEISNEWYDYINEHKYLDEDIVKNSLDKLYSSNLEIYIDFLKKILYISNKSGLVFATEQYNVSFQDIIYNVYPDQWKVGYTGTVYLNPDIYFEEDTFVFKNIKEDFDEKIEVKLALKGYGCPTNYSNSVVIINTDTQKEVLNQLLTIISSGVNRGVVDIAGLFIDYTNIDIAILLKQLLPEKHIVYLSDKHEGLEYDTTSIITKNLNNKYKPFDNNNFYYYDQCHIVGTDLEQPTVGCIAVIINKHTKWTEFAQGIFRFRKLNRGTYLKLFYICVSADEKTALTNDNILDLLIKNESEFEKSQEIGLKYQLMKAMVRKISTNYLEDTLINHFLLSTVITPKDCIDFLENNIKYLQPVPNIKDPYLNYIYELYKYITNDQNKLIKLIIGSDTIKKEIDMEIMEDKDVQKLSVELYGYNKKITHKYDIITHLNCKQCIDSTSVSLFLNDYNCLINGKKIYISINIALGFENKHQTIDTSLLILVELPDIFILEIDYIAYDYYSHKVPIYSFLSGRLLNTFLKNTFSLYPLKLDIDYRFLYLFDNNYYINPIKEKNQNIITKQIIKDIENNINIEASKIIFFLNNNLTEDYKNYFDNTPIIQHLLKISNPDDVIELIKSIPDNNIEHEPKYRLDNIHFYRESGINGIALKTDVFDKIRRVPFQIIYNQNYYRLRSVLK
jgi:hypothetical protein